MRPVEILTVGLPDQVSVGLGIEADKASARTIEARCRKCEPCLEWRSRLWAARACSELELTPGRSWFGTLTLNPYAVQVFEYRARGEVELRRAEAWSALDRDERFKAMVAEVNTELTLWLKRLRKSSGAKLRYLLICEAHKSGVPHWHLLLHEWSGSVTKRALESSWRVGFSHWRLVPDEDRQHAFYVSKYLAKSALARVRASFKYGNLELLLTERERALASRRQRDDSSPNEGTPSSKPVD